MACIVMGATTTATQMGVHTTTVGQDTASTRPPVLSDRHYCKERCVICLIGGNSLSDQIRVCKFLLFLFINQHSVLYNTSLIEMKCQGVVRFLAQQLVISRASFQVVVVLKEKKTHRPQLKLAAMIGPETRV
jgi:hypothetical protein